MTDDIAAWLTACLDEIERVARGAIGPEDGEGAWWTAFDVGDHYNYPVAGRGRPPLQDGITSPADDVISRLDPFDESTTAAHIALNDPRAVLARVEAERAIVTLWPGDLGAEIAKRLDELGSRNAVIEQVGIRSVRLVLESTIKSLAYGHRFDHPGYDPAWKPEEAP